MPDDPIPKPFTDAQRKLFAVIDRLNRSKPDQFTEADRFIDTPPKTPTEELAEYRQQCRREREYRREDKDRASMILDGQWHHAFLKLCRLEVKYNLLADVALMDEHVNRGAFEKGAFFPLESSETLLRRQRRIHAQNIRGALRNFSENISEYQPPRSDELLSWTAGKMLGENTPDFDRMDAARVLLWAPRVVRVVWALSERGELSGTKVKWLAEMPWNGPRPGESHDGYLGRCCLFDGIGRGWVSHELLDPRLEHWQKLASDALREWEKAEPAATILPAPPAAQDGKGKHIEQSTLPPPLNETDRKAAKYIRANPKCKGDAVASAIVVTSEHFRSRIFPKLSKHGFYNSGDGYCPPKRGKKAVI